MAEGVNDSQEKEQEDIHTISLSELATAVVTIETASRFLQSCVYIPKEASVLSGFAQNSDRFEPLVGETEEDSRRRYLAYTNTWTHIKQCMDELLSQQHNALLGQVVQFVMIAKKQWIDAEEIEHHQSPVAVILPPYLTMIPTAAIIAGVTFSDHEILYQHLVTRLGTEVTPHIVRLKSHDCSLGMSAIVKEIHNQLIDGWIPDREKSTQRANSYQKRLPRLTMSTLLSWHLKKLVHKKSSEEEIERLSDEDCEIIIEDNSCASNEAKLEPANHKPVVFVLEDFDKFSPQVLEDLVVSLKPHLPSLPLVLILGVSTSISLCSLTQSVLSDLFIEHFRVQPAAATLNAAINKILIDSSLLRFRLQDKALNYLLHHFLNLNFSIMEFQKGLQFAAMEHFCWQPLSFLCNTSHSVTDMVKSMSHLQFEMTRSVPSFRKYVESLSDPVKQLDLLTDDLKLQPMIVHFFTDITDHHESSPVLLHCLHILTRDLPGAPLGSQIYDLYYQSLQKNIIESDDFESAWKFVRLMTRDKLKESLTKCVELLKKYSCSLLSDVTKTLESFVQQLFQLSDGDRTQTIKDNKAIRKKKQATDFEKIRTNILDYILGAMRKHLRCISTFPLHEIFYFNQASWMKRHLNPVISNEIHKALCNPSLYILTAGSVSEESGIDPNMPDVCIVYQLYLECGKLINTEEWKEAFLSIVSPNMEEDNQDILHERFHSAISQLQFIGFVRPAKRKKDHMQRLTWYH